MIDSLSARHGASRSGPGSPPRTLPGCLGSARGNPGLECWWSAYSAGAGGYCVPAGQFRRLGFWVFFSAMECRCRLERREGPQTGAAMTVTVAAGAAADVSDVAAGGAGVADVVVGGCDGSDVVAVVAVVVVVASAAGKEGG